MVGKASLFGSVLFSAVFLITGAAMLFVAMNDGWVRAMDSGATCASGSGCGSVRVTLFIVGGSFAATGLFSAFLTYYIARRARRWMARIATARPLDSTESIAGFLKPFGIELSGATLRDPATTGMAAQLAAPSAPRRERATIIRKHDRGATAGQQRLVEFELEVAPASAAPYRVTVASLVRESLVGLLVEGGTLTVRVDQDDRENVTIDWTEN
jgi:hypothetical protein